MVQVKRQIAAFGRLLMVSCLLINLAMSPEIVYCFHDAGAAMISAWPANMGTCVCHEAAVTIGEQSLMDHEHVDISMSMIGIIQPRPRETGADFDIVGPCRLVVSDVSTPSKANSCLTTGELPPMVIPRPSPVETFAIMRH